MDITKVRPTGPWILVKADPPPEKTKGGLYIPDGNLQERLGHVKATVLRAGPGKFAEGKEAKKRKYVPHGLKPGDRIVFRGFLKEANRPGGMTDREHSLIHIDDVLGYLEEEHDVI